MRMHYDGNCGAFIFLLIVNNLWHNVRIRDFFVLIFWTNNYVTRTAKNKSLVTYSRLFSNLYTPQEESPDCTAKLAIILHPQNIDGSIHPPPVQP